MNKPSESLSFAPSSFLKRIYQKHSKLHKSHIFPSSPSHTSINSHLQLHTTMNRPPKIPIPDLRFEQLFLRSLDAYASASVKPLSDAELQNVDDEAEDKETQLKPIAPITPGIVVLAVIKDQILMPLLQGFLWSGFLLMVRPALGLVVASGQSTGKWFYNFLGLGNARRYAVR